LAAVIDQAGVIACARWTVCSAVRGRRPAGPRGPLGKRRSGA